jgi:hypothetical protein
MGYFFAFVCGLLVAWNLVPQPSWVFDALSSIVKLFKS